MCTKSRNWFVVLAAGLAASLSAGTIATAAPISAGIKVPLVQSDVLQVGYRGHDPYGNNGFYYWPAYDYDPPRRNFWPPPPEPSYQTIYFDEHDDDSWSPPRRRYRSCGQYHYRSGGCCLDARWHKPYIGPKW